MNVDARLVEPGFTLPTVPAPVATDVPFVFSGRSVFLSGQGRRRPEVGFYGGKDGAKVTMEEAYRHARSAVGMGSLPEGMTVEIEAIAELG